MMKMEFPIGRNKTIDFISDLDIFPPVPAKSLVPQWYKDSEKTFLDNDNVEHNGLKKCIPFLDTMISGYIIRLHKGVLVTRVNNNIFVNGQSVHERYYKMGNMVPVPAGHETNKFVWENQWAWKTPKGWSTIITHPLNRFDLPFTTLSGVVDSDNFVSSGNLPFYIKSDFEGVIPAGTPIAQIIPIKRERWISKTIKDLSFISEYTGKDHYKKFDWRKKQYD